MHEKKLEEIRSEEERLRFPEFDEGLAWQIGSALVAEALQRQLPLVVNIRTPDATLFHAALAGSAPTHEDWARRKSNTTFRYQKASYAVGLEFSARGIEAPGIDQGMPPSDFAPHGGSFPIRLIKGRVIAAVTVSGLPQEEDHDLVVAALSRCLANIRA